MYEAQRKYEKEKTGNIRIQAKKEIINDIRNTATDNNVSAQKLLIACYNYCIDNHINISDLKKYID